MDEAQLEQMLRDAESDVSLEVTLLPYLPTMCGIEEEPVVVSQAVPVAQPQSQNEGLPVPGPIGKKRSTLAQWSRGWGKRGGRGTTSTSSNGVGR